MQALDASLIAISPQSPDNSLTIAEKNDLQFEVLSDAGNGVARQFGLAFRLVDELQGLFDKMGIHLPKYNDDDAWELPIPGTYVIDRDGAIATWESANQVRPSPRLEQVAAQAREGKTVDEIVNNPL